MVIRCSLFYFRILSFFLLIALASNYLNILNETGKCCHPCLIPGLTQKGLNFFPMQFNVICLILGMTSTVLRDVLPVHTHSAFLSNASIEMSMFFTL
jgi:hypothetical protein